MIRPSLCFILLLAGSSLVVVQLLKASNGIAVIPLQHDDAFRMPSFVSANQNNTQTVPLRIAVKVEGLTQRKHDVVSASIPRSKFVDTVAASVDEAKNESFSACLLVMDENFRLREWIAYHYHVLPLRYMVVAVDPRSQHSPEPIFEQFREKLNMTIISWNDSDFADFTPLSPDASSHQLITRHDLRQRQFMQRCMRHLYQKNRTWTAMWDTDEYITFNGYNVTKSSLSPSDMSKSGAILQYVKDSRIERCVPVGRVLVGNKEVPTLMKEAHPVDPRRFDTLRFRYRGRMIALDHAKVHGIAKCLLNVQKIPSFPVKVDNPHRPVKEICGSVLGGEHIVNGPFIIHHYLGTWEAYSFRDDSRRGQHKSYKAYLDKGKIGDFYDDKVVPWMSSFMTAVGEVDGKSILQESGLDPEYNASFKIDLFKPTVIYPNYAEIRRRNRLRRQKKRQQENTTSLSLLLS